MKEPPSLEDAKKLDLDMLIQVWQARHELSSAGLSGVVGAGNRTTATGVSASNLGTTGGSTIQPQPVGGPRPRRTASQRAPPHLSKSTGAPLGSPIFPWETPPMPSTNLNRRGTAASRKVNLNDLLVDRFVEEKFGL